MATTTWDEIKKLAADFQRVQLVENSFKLSERNCIEIINKLVESGLLTVVHTIDGKDFLTTKQVEKEIYDELIVHEGRVNIVKLQTLLNVDISHIEVKVSEIVKNDPNLVLILGQIISKDYMNKMAEEINETLQEKESISVAELTNIYELPTDFIQQVLTPRIGNLIKGNFDGKILYTFNFVNKQKAVLKGALEACLKPVRFSQVIKEYNLESSMVFDIFNELLGAGQIKGTLFGGKQEMSAVFVPEFYAKAQRQYVESFFKQNGYIEYSSMKKIGISEPDAFVKSLFENQQIKYLSSSCFAQYYLNNLEEDIDDHLNRNGLCDLSQILPSILNEKDLASMTKFFSEQLIKSKSDSSMIVMAETYLIKKSFLQDLQTKFQAKMEQKAEEDLKKPNIVLAFRSEHAVIAGSQSTQTTSKPTKSKGKKSAASESANDNFIEISFIDKVTLIKELKSIINELDDELIEPLVEYFLKPLNYSYFELLKTKIQTGLVPIGDNPERPGASPASPQKNSIKDVQERVKLLLVNAKIFDKALKSLADTKTQEIIGKHLAKTCFSEIFNEVLRFIANEQLITFSEENLNPDSRAKIVQKLKDPAKQQLTELNQAFSNKTSTEIIELVEKAANELLEIPSKKADTKREKEVVLQLRESIKESLNKEEDPATVLHQVCILLYYHSTGFVLNAPGRCVPSILDALKSDLNSDAFNKLTDFQNMVIKSLNKNKSTDEAMIRAELIDEIKNIGLNPKNFLTK